MRVVRDLPVPGEKWFRKTLVQGRDENYYTVASLKLYERDPAAEFANFEVNVAQTNAEGRYKVLVQPFFQRFYTKDEAVKMHETLLERLDDLLKLQPPAKKKEKEAAEEH